MSLTLRLSGALLLLLLVAATLAGCQQQTIEPTPIPPPTDIPVEPTAEPTPLPPPEVEPTDEPAEPTAAPTPTEPTPAEPTPIPTEPPPDPEPVGDYPFQLTAGLADDVAVNQIEGEDDPWNAPYWAVFPAHTEYLLVDYPLDDSFHQPRILIYPARDFSDLNPAARHNIEALQDLLAEKPALTAGLFGLDPLPFLPIFNAAQVFAVQAEYLSFANGEGIRYLTQYSQAIMPVTNSNLFYTFQGLSDDGAYYVAAILPVALPDFLPDDDEINQAAVADISGEEFEVYLEDLLESLGEMPAESFTPSLAGLDEMMQSLSLDAPAEIAGDELTMRHPVAQAQLPMGRTILVEGYAPAGLDEVELSLSSGPATLLTAAALPDAAGKWSAELTIPSQIEGPALLTARAGEQSVSHMVNLIAYASPDELATGLVAERPLELYRPTLGERAVSGTTLFFEGRAEEALIDETLTIGVLIDDCTRFIARQSFTVPGGQGAWYGQVILPEDVAPQRGCAIAYTGDYGEGEWWGAQAPLPIVSPAEAVGQISLLLPLRGEGWAGGELLLEGATVGAPQGRVLIAINTPDGELLASAEASVNQFNYWQTTLSLPDHYTGLALITVTTPGLSEEESFYQTGLDIR